MKRPEPARTGRVTREGDWWVLDLDWIPVAKKSRMHEMVKADHDARTVKRHWFPDSKVVKDEKAIRGILAKGMETFPAWGCAHSWEAHVTVYRPMSKAEEKTGVWNRRRGDPCSAHELVFDAVQGFFWQDDSNVTRIFIEEDRRGPARGLRLRARPRPGAFT